MKVQIKEVNVPNPNGIVYTKEICEEMVKQINENDRCFGTLDTEPHIDVDFNKVSHKVENAELKDEKVWVDIKVLEGTPNGKLLKGLLDNDVDLMFRPNALVSYEDSTADLKVINEMNLISIDVMPKED